MALALRKCRERSQLRKVLINKVQEVADDCPLGNGNNITFNQFGPSSQEFSPINWLYSAIEANVRSVKIQILSLTGGDGTIQLGLNDDQ